MSIQEHIRTDDDSEGHVQVTGPRDLKPLSLPVTGVFLLMLRLGHKAVGVWVFVLDPWIDDRPSVVDPLELLT